MSSSPYTRYQTGAMTTQRPVYASLSQSGSAASTPGLRERYALRSRSTYALRNWRLRPSGKTISTCSDVAEVTRPSP